MLHAPGGGQTRDLSILSPHPDQARVRKRTYPIRSASGFPREAPNGRARRLDFRRNGGGTTRHRGPLRLERERAVLGKLLDLRQCEAHEGDAGGRTPRRLRVRRVRLSRAILIARVELCGGACHECIPRASILHPLEATGQRSRFDDPVGAARTGTMPLIVTGRGHRSGSRAVEIRVPGVREVSGHGLIGATAVVKERLRFRRVGSRAGDFADR